MPFPVSEGRGPIRKRGSILTCVLLALMACLAVSAFPRAGRTDEKTPKAGKAPAGPKIPPGVGFLADQTYCSLRDCRPCLNVCPLRGGYIVDCSCQVRDCNLKLNVAWPMKGKGPFPAVVLIHGGGWLYGSHHDLVPLSLRLAEQGFVAITVTYRLLPHYRFPDQLHDVKCAVRWLRANAGRYKANPDRVGVFGHSAGGHLACMLGMTCGRDDLEGNGGFKDQRSDVRCIVCTSGMTDLAHLYTFPARGIAGAIAKRAVEKFVGAPPARAAKTYEMASPISYATRSCPPTLLICGTKDDVIPNEQSLRLEKRLREAGADVRLLTLLGAAHDFLGIHRERAEAAALDFFKRHLK
jgi:acetyl esterase/lipase